MCIVHAATPPQRNGTEDDDAHLNATRSEDLGNIILEIDRVEDDESVPPTTMTWTPVADLDTKLHERSKKAVAHCVQ